VLLVSHWFRAFAWTLLLEQLVAALVLRSALPNLARRLSVIAVVNIASHPAVWLIFPELGSALGLSRLGTTALSEAWAFGLEAWIYWLFLGGQGRLAVKTSVLANSVSLGLGFALRGLGWV